MKSCLLILFSIVFLFYLSFTLSAQQAQSDNGDGTYTNPVIASDFPDTDVILVDDTTESDKNFVPISKDSLV